VEKAQPLQKAKNVVEHSLELQERSTRLQKKAKLAREHGAAAVRHAEQVKAELKLQRDKQKAAGR
jgi:hypothetical protein